MWGYSRATEWGSQFNLKFTLRVFVERRYLAKRFGALPFYLNLNSFKISEIVFRLKIDSTFAQLCAAFVKGRSAFID